MTHRVPSVMNTRLKMAMAAAEMLYSEGDYVETRRGKREEKEEEDEDTSRGKREETD